MQKLNLENARFDYEPYPVCYIPDFFTPEDYKVLSETYPSLDNFFHQPNQGNKYSFAEFNGKQKYYDFLKANPKWQEFYNTVKSKEFVEKILQFFDDNHINLGIRKFKYTGVINMKKFRLGYFKRGTTVRSRMEFAAMGANGGHILPHTDARTKLVTIVLSMIKPGEWDSKWGGGTDVLIPEDRKLIYNQVNKQRPFEGMEPVKTFPFNPNQSVMFVKTYNSWHSVTPMTGPEGTIRKTVTINIEQVA